MNVANLISYGLQAAVLVSIGLLLPRILRLPSPVVALRYWQVLLAMVLLLPFLQPWRVASVGSVTVQGLGVLMAAGAPSVAPATGGATVTERLLIAVVVVAAARLIWLAVGLVMLRRYQTGARPLERLPLAVDDLQGGSSTRARFLVSDRVPVPITFGWRRPTVLLPAGFESLPEAHRVAILCHELLHVRRRDWLSVVGERGLRAVLWFHPAVPILLRRIGLSREQLIDREVVRLTGRRRDYLDALWSMARQQDRPASAPALSLLDRSDLFERVAALTREVNMSKMRLATAVVALGALVLTTGVAVAAAFPLVRAEAGELAVSTASSQAGVVVASDESGPVRYEPNGEVTEPKVISKVNPVYPEEARKERITGVVVCETIITAEGRISDVKILRTADEIFNQPTIDALMQWRFEPATLHGKPVDVIYVVTVKYNLSKDKPKSDENDG